MLSLSLLSSICSSDDNDTDSNSYQIQQIKTAMQMGNWIITYFEDSGTIETNNFSGYIFTFASNDNLIANNNANMYTGTWSVTNSSSSSSSSSDDIDFNILFNSPPNFEELSEDWDIISHTSAKIELIHVSGGNGGTDYLTFERQ